PSDGGLRVVPQPSERPPQRRLELTICCACSKGLPWPSHDVDGSRRGCSGDGFPLRYAIRRGAGRAAAYRRERGRRRRMGSIGRYIFRITLGAFLLVCVCVTALMWITQALRDVDLMTDQGQSIFVFIGITSLIIPLLLMIIAPIALMIAVAYVLNKLGNDSELI